MGRIYDSVHRFFTEDDWKFHALPDRPTLSMRYSSAVGTWQCYAETKEEDGQFIFYSVCPVNAPEHRRLAVAEFLTRVNYALILGNFEMDFSDGEIRYKTSARVGDEDEFPQGLIRHMVYANLRMMDRYFPGMMTVMFGGAEPAEMMKQIEG